MTSHQQAEEIAERYRAMGARDCTAEMVMKFLCVVKDCGHTIVYAGGPCKRELEGDHA